MAFPCGYASLMAQVLSDIFNFWFNTDIHYYWYIAIGEVLVLLPICYVRNIKFFSNMHLVGDVAVLLTVGTLAYSSIYDISQKTDFNFGSLKLINSGWFKVLGMCITSLEGIGVLLPVKVITIDNKI
jgi:amino acid permease